jgi:putative oxidoreductase
MKNLIQSTEADRTTILIRLMVGLYFLAGGILKLYIPGLQETGYFQNIGFAAPETITLTLSILEVIFGLLIVAGLFTRVAVVFLLLTIAFTFFAGKLSILFEEGFFLMAHLSRIDFAMFLGCIFLLMKGSGYWSLDYSMGNKTETY